MSLETERTLALDERGSADRLDRTLARTWDDLSRSRLQALIRGGQVTVDGAVVLDPAWKGASGAVVRIKLPPPTPATPQAERIALAVAYEDDDVIVVDKPAGMVVHPAPGNWTGTLVNALKGRGGPLSTGSEEGREGIVRAS